MNKNIDNDLKELIETVQHNCHIADARHAGDYTLCVYLLKMREMYRWEQGIDFKTQLTTDDVGDWLTEREGLWDDIEEQDYKPLIINGDSFEPFDNDLINVLLDKNRLVYNAGLGIRCRPHFFVADLEEMVRHDGYTVYISGKEYARDMAAPAAMAQENNIFVRRESLKRVIWEILDDARVTGLDNPLTRAMSYYDFDNDAEAAINKMTEAEIVFVIQHEIGEVQAGKILGDGWNKMMTGLARTQAEIMLRAIRDHLADSLTTLPVLIEQNNKASIHFYFGNMTAMRKQLAPALVDAYKKWHETGETEQLKMLIDQSWQHWQNLALSVNELYSNSIKAEPIEELIMATKLI
jgi:hypothetical protein